MVRRRIATARGESVVVPIVSVTPLGSAASGTGAAVGQIIDYLERGSRRPQPNASITGYYADTPTTTGVWRGRGVDAHQLTGPVDTGTFRSVLEGRHPQTGETLVSAVGSSGRAGRDRDRPVLTGDPGQLIDVQGAAALLGVAATYVQRLALETERDPETKTPLHGVRDEQNRWQFTRAELDRFAATRTEAIRSSARATRHPHRSAYPALHAPRRSAEWQPLAIHGRVREGLSAATWQWPFNGHR